MTDRALTLRLDEATYQALRLEAFQREHPITRLIREAIAARYGSEPRALTLMTNPEMPSDEELEEVASLAIVEHWSGDVIAVANADQSEVDSVGYRAIRRHGCDAGMIADRKAPDLSTPEGQS